MNKMECAALLKLLEDHESSFPLKNINHLNIPPGLVDIVTHKISLNDLRENFEKGYYKSS